jgi:phage terminase large subunit-like protein
MAESATWELKRERLQLQEEKLRRMKFNRAAYLFPTEGPFRRELYSKHIAFFNAGIEFKERCVMGGSRTGKTEAGAYEAMCHSTGIYPHWWQGKVFNVSTSGVAAGKSGKVVRDTIQKKLIGYPDGEFGTGLIPRDLLIAEDCKRASGTPDLYDIVAVRHKAGGKSIINLKSYDQGREAFEGTERHWVWEDEEADIPIHGENVARTMTTNGVVWNTYTPLKGQTELTRDFEKRSKGNNPSVHLVRITWDDAPHLTEEMRASMEAIYKPHEMKARRWGIPKMGSGAIFITDFDEVLACKPFRIPAYWPRAYGLDFGWSPHPTAAVWGALDRESDTIYLYSEHRMKEELPSAHADAIKMRGDWIKGNSETAGINMSDGKRMIDIYRGMGLHLIKAKKDVEGGIYVMRQRIETGRLRVFNTLQMWREEYESYQRDEGKITKSHDDLMDATRYLLSRMDTFQTKPHKRPASVVRATQFGDYVL